MLPHSPIFIRTAIFCATKQIAKYRYYNWIRSLIVWDNAPFYNEQNSIAAISITCKKMGLLKSIKEMEFHWPES